MMRIVRLFAALLGLVALGMTALLVAASGVLPVKASSGHWPWTAAFLHFGARRSVATWSMGVAVPALDDPRMVLVGAGHYEGGCRPCHGVPGSGPPAFTIEMTPRPPDLARSADWDPEDLFYMIKHGVKFTGMPGWPDLRRNDEVWAMVAYLQREGHRSRSGYEALVFGELDPASVPAPVADCARCHGADGLGRGAFPRLAGQQPRYMADALRAYKARERSSGVMQVAVQDLVDEQIDEIARWFAALPPGPAWPVPAEADLARGEAIATGQTALPACAQCHGPAQTPRNPAYPRLQGQDPEYLALQLALFRERRRGGARFADLMETVAAHGLDEAQIRDVTAWYAAQPLEAAPAR